jgi:tRNA A-37 threonylcarbamoyl transferase component Bud32
MARNFTLYREFLLADHRFYEELARIDYEYRLERQLRTLESEDTEVARRGVWAVCRPTAVPLPAHGWKIHVSATPDCAEHALAVVMAQFRRSPFHFKVLRDRQLVIGATSRWWAAGQVGKVITIYAGSEDAARTMLATLHPLLADVVGPYVLTDRRYADSQCLYYRYGEFRSTSRLESNGTSTPMFTGPNGEEWIETRKPVYRLPPWIPDLFPPDPPAESADHVIHGYRMHGVLHHTGCGGVYLAERLSDGTTVVVKESRPNTAFATDGSSGQDRLRLEYEALCALRGSGVAPEPIELFQEWEHLFLVQEYIKGSPLMPIIALHHPLVDGSADEDDLRAYRELRATVMAGVRHAVDTVHERGLCFGDVSPNNVIIDPDTFRVWLVDFECARPLATWQPGLPVTPGFTADEGSPTLLDGAALDNLGVAAIELALVFPRNSLRMLSPATLARSTAHVAAMLGEPVDELLRRQELPTEQDPAMPTDIDVVVKESVRFIEATMTTERADRVFAADPLLFLTNAWSVSHGVAGVVRALHRLSGGLPDQLTEWVLRHIDGTTELPASLYLGASGVGWTLLEAGLPEQGARVLEQALRRPGLDLPAEVEAGWAGVGLAALAGWRATGDDTFLRHATDIGDRLIGSAKDSGRGLYWTSGGERHRSVGYAHGSAGVALFLLYLHCATEDARFLTFGSRALRHDLNQELPRARGGSGYPAFVDNAQLEPYWERGSAGVGVALARYCRFTGDARLREKLDRMVTSNLIGAAINPGLFIGMSGLVNLASDCRTLFGDPSYADQAAGMAASVLSLACREPEGIAFPGHGLLRYSTDFATGNAGIALTLDRLHTGGTDFNYTLDSLLPGVTEAGSSHA